MAIGHQEYQLELHCIAAHYFDTHYLASETAVNHFDCFAVDYLGIAADVVEELVVGYFGCFVEEFPAG